MKNTKVSITSIMIALLSFALTTSIAQAKKPYWKPNDSNSTYNYSNSPVRIDVVGDHGRVLNKFSTSNRGYKTQRAYLEAIKGKRYQLRIRNTSNRRVGVVIAVDGRNILSGRKSYLGSNEKMYILDPYETTNYKGWRTNKNRVNRFYFTSAGGSYANAWGDRSAMGVIAVAVFNEKRRQHYNKKYRRGDMNKDGASSRRGYLAEESTGTGFGREEYSPTIRVNFKTKKNPSFKHFLKYEWRNTLCKRGIISCGYNNRKEHNRFWPRKSNNGYAPYPPGYRTGSRIQKWDDVVIKDRNFGTTIGRW